LFIGRPAAAIHALAQMGMTFPPEPLALTTPPYDLFNIPFSYAKVSNEAVPLYGSLEDAQNNVVKKQMAAGHIKYVSVSNKTTTDKGTYFQISTGDWINGDVISRVGVPYFQGYLIKQFPSASFGWVLQDAPVYRAPGYTSEQTGKVYHRLDMVMAYASQTVDNMEWVMVGQNEWIEHRFLARAINNPTPPEGVTNGRWIEVNLYEQVLTVYDQNKMVFATLIASGGKPFYTQPGRSRSIKRSSTST
jgi:hypothetical protein